MAQESLAGRHITDHPGTFTDVIPLGGLLMPPTVGANTGRISILKSLNGYIFLTNAGGGVSVGQPNVLFKKNNGFSPFLVSLASTNSHGNYCFVHSDALVTAASGGTTARAVNLRQTGAARNLNGNAALPGVSHILNFDSTNVTNVAFQSLPAATNPSYGNGTNHYEDARFLISAPTTDSTYPTVASPSAPTVAAATSGGALADATYYVKIAWVTKTNKWYTGHGFTAASAESSATVSGGGGAGRLDVTIPSPPSNAIGYVVYVGTVSGTNYVCGGGDAAAVVHVVKSTMAQLNMKDRIFYISSSGLQMQTMGTIENASPLTNATVRATTSNYHSMLWSPYFLDPSQFYCLPYGLGTVSSSTQKGDKYSITAGTIALNQTLGWTGEPNLTIANTGNAYDVTTTRSIPEMGAYAVIRQGYKLAANDYLLTPFMVQIRSCFDNQILWTYAHDDYIGYGEAAPVSWDGPCDFETINGITYMYVVSNKKQGIIRCAIRILPD